MSIYRGDSKTDLLPGDPKDKKAMVSIKSFLAKSFFSQKFFAVSTAMSYLSSKIQD
jgi:hypothetical protein